MYLVVKVESCAEVCQSYMVSSQGRAARALLCDFASIQVGSTDCSDTRCLVRWLSARLATRTYAGLRHRECDLLR